VILIDTSVWVDHLRSANRRLADLLEAGMVLVHPFVIGEIALGNLGQRRLVLDALMHLPPSRLATDDEVFHFIEHQRLSGRGIGYIDAHLLAAVRLTAGATLWTRDTRLRAVASELRLSADIGPHSGPK
jgi:predicted nucleic acid-binding protein